MRPLSHTVRRTHALGALALALSAGLAAGAGGEVGAPPPPPGGAAPALPSLPVPGGGFPGASPLALPPAPGGQPGLPTGPGGLPPLPDAGGLAPVTPFGAPGAGAPGATGFATDPSAGGGTALPSITTPPPLSDLGGTVASTDASTTATTGTASNGNIETYAFLFRDSPNLGVVRDKLSPNDADVAKRQEVQRLTQRFTQGPNGVPAGAVAGPAPGQAGPNGQNQGADPRVSAEWDFYFEQLELYSRFVTERVLPGAGGTQGLAKPTYASGSMDSVMQEREGLKDSYRKAALASVNEQWNENRLFYQRLQDREDRRRAFREWVESQRRDLQRWTELWGRKANGTAWADGQPVGRDDWYRGAHVNARGPVALSVSGQEFLMSREAQRAVPSSTLNVISTNLTPYDLIDAQGNVKSPPVERLRGTLVRPPQSPMQQTTGTVELGI